MNTIFVLLFLVLSTTAFADDVSLIQTNAVIKEAAPEEVVAEAPKPSPSPAIVDSDLQRMKEFVKEENERLKAIKILNLDLEQASLELKKREIEVKLAGLSSSPNTQSSLSRLSDENGAHPMIKVVGIMLSGDVRSAKLDIGGVISSVSEGKTIKNGVIIKKIFEDGVVIAYLDGREETINFGV